MLGILLAFIGRTGARSASPAGGSPEAEQAGLRGGAGRIIYMQVDLGPDLHIARRASVPHHPRGRQAARDSKEQEEFRKEERPRSSPYSPTSTLTPCRR